mmetsp:Transcript_22911/g.48713  ORF Transcript_22911/g.48713 Transcript_22911/m.48713 type:complete len:100 (+) Transcript_22911:377-676(+)
MHKHLRSQSAVIHIAATFFILKRAAPQPAVSPCPCETGKLQATLQALEVLQGSRKRGNKTHKPTVGTAASAAAAAAAESTQQVISMCMLHIPHLRPSLV